MQPSFRALMNEIIDHAGLFPPARLELSDAFNSYLESSSSRDGWMLARFVIPAVRLADLAPLLGRMRQPDLRIRLAVLGRGGTSAAGFASAVTSDIADVRRFVERHANRAVVDQIELRLPESVGEIPAATSEALELLGDLPAVVPFFEVSLLEGWRARLARAVDVLAPAVVSGRKAGLKMRCGGLEAAAVPSPVAVAAALSTCRRARIPVKATQGLHHPLRRFDHTLEITTHGFFNVFIAGVLGHVHALSEERLLGLLVDEDPAAFRFSTDTLAWNGLSATIDEIVTARTTVVTSFGSCSFSEPSDDLRALGLLDDEPLA
jgi:hypothetical protein